MTPSSWCRTITSRWHHHPNRLPRATILTFWHIPWPNAERFGICPFYAELLDWLLGSSIVGFHTQLHCNNFIDSVDRSGILIDRPAQAIVQGGMRRWCAPIRSRFSGPCTGSKTLILWLSVVGR